MEAKFGKGQIIHHKRYGYRGVIVAWDVACRADEAWYQKNQTQPERDQPWYHVLVDESSHTTYVAEENLELAEDVEEVQHPLVDKFFVSYYEGRYYRDSLN